MVRHLFETRTDRRQAPHIARRASGWPQFRWLPQEDTIALRADLSLRQIAARLNALPINQERRAVRTEMAVSRRCAVLRQRSPPRWAKRISQACRGPDQRRQHTVMTA